MISVTFIYYNGILYAILEALSLSLHRSRMEKSSKMTFDRILFLLPICLLSNSFAYSRPEKSFSGQLEEAEKSNIQSNYTVCRTDACQQIAYELLNSMNQSINPCNDFYEFTCGRWGKAHKIPPYWPLWNRIMMFQTLVLRRLKGILETEPQTEDVLPVRQAKKWFRSCMDEDVLESRGITPLESILMRVGGWPMVMDPEEWDSDEYSWRTVEHNYFHITGSYALYKINPPIYIGGWKKDIGIAPGDFPFSEKLSFAYRNYTGEDYTAYMELVAGVAQIFVEYNKADISDEMLRNDVRDLVEFEKQLYLITNQELKNRYESTTLDNFTEWYKRNISEAGDGDFDQKINFQKLIQTMMDLINIEAKHTMEISVRDKRYFPKLTKLLNETPQRTIVNYLHWHFVSGMITYTTDTMRNLFFAIIEKEFGVTERPPRWWECVKQTQMTEAAAYVFMKNYFSEKTEKIMLDTVDNIREGMKTVINRSNWLQDEDKETLQKKLGKMEFYVGVPDWFKNNTVIVNSFKGLTIGYDFIDNVLSYRRYTLKSKLRNLDPANYHPRGKQSSWALDAITVNAAYGSNEVEVPAVDFQSPLFTPQLPESINYGMTGVVIGHEVGHGYDINEISYSADGDGGELSQSTLEKYVELAQCFINQFNELFNDTDQELMLGTRTLKENLADATGLQSVLIAYRNLVKRNGGTDTKLPGFEEFTNDQMFFISYGSVWCETMTPQYAEKRKLADNHSPGRLRVLGGVSNMEDFAKAFNCPKGSPMNPENKCNIWNTP